MPAEELDEELERLAANLSVSVGIESGVATLDLLKKDLDRGLTIFADVLRHPRFDAGRVELVKLQAKESIRRRYDQPQGIASRELTARFSKAARRDFTSVASACWLASETAPVLSP